MKGLETRQIFTSQVRTVEIPYILLAALLRANGGSLVLDQHDLAEFTTPVSFTNQTHFESHIEFSITRDPYRMIVRLEEVSP